MKGMYEAWNDKMWRDASTLLIWMSHPAYPSFVWQTYDYYYDPTGCYWGAKEACEPQHVQWNCLTNSVKVINTTSSRIENATVETEIFDMNGKRVAHQAKSGIDVEASNIAEAFVLDMPKSYIGDMLFIRMKLVLNGVTKDTNFYWTNQKKEYDYRALNGMPQAKLECSVTKVSDAHYQLTLKNPTANVSFANRIRLVDAKTGERLLPTIMSDGYVTLMPSEELNVEIETTTETQSKKFNILVKQYGKKEYIAVKGVR